jgi:hypothetical protein
MPAVDFVDLVNGLSDHWGPHEENTARLLEAQAYRLELDWADRTVDPNDDETRRARAQAKRDGIKPPPHPMVPPVALRPPKLAEQAYEEFFARLEQHRTPAEPSAFVDRSAFDSSLGLT